ncbi:ACP S-malonyltransferase [Sorangium sp. So ce1014]|uniref:ACP S-malonyltransferase n=1 Tax=Sorangium sp. So ce1014 TaxID=3133326 RepID=UPI003F6073FE
MNNVHDLSASQSASLWFLGRHARPQARLRLFCFPYAGKGASVYLRWAGELPDSVDVLAVQLPGREGRVKEKPAERLMPLVDELVGAIAPLLDRPFALFGHSMGTLLAFEVARKLRARHGKEPVHLFVSGRGAPHVPRRTPDLHRLSDAQLVTALQGTYGGIPDVVREDVGLLQLFLPALRADLAMLETYVFQPGAKLRCPISALGGDRDPHANVQDLRAWGEQTEASFRLRMLEGDHFFVNSARAEVLQSIVADLGPLHGGGVASPGVNGAAERGHPAVHRETKIVVFPGQGSQRKGMGKDLFDAYPKHVAEADEILGYSVRRLCLDDPGRELSLTKYTQPALFVVNALSYLARLDRGEAPPDVVAGHSLGEYNALFAAGVFDFATGVRLVQRRGELMSQAKEGAMAAVIGLSPERIRELLDAAGLHGVDIANLNTSRQTVIGGPAADLKQAGPLFIEAGARYVPLNVSAAFHTRYMQPTQRVFGEFLERFRFAPPRIPVISNDAARRYPDDEGSIRAHLTRQIASPVRWYETVSHLLTCPEAQFEEVGPGNVLTRTIDEIRAAPLPVEPFPARAVAEPRKEPLAAESLVRAEPLRAEPPRKEPLAAESLVRAEPLRAEPPRKEPLAAESLVRAEPPRASAAAATLQPRPPRDGVVFLYTGQGSQYFGMGAEFYEKEATFRAAIERCSALAAPLLGRSLVDILYRSAGPFQPFDRVLHSNPAMLAIGYALTQTLEARGVRPDVVLGYGVGEHTAAVVAGALSLEDGLALAIEQARLLEERARPGAMLAVFDSHELMERHASIFSDCELAGISFQRHFVVSGPAPEVAEAARKLKALGIVTFLLPIGYALHSSWMDSIEAPFRRFASRLTLKPPRVAIFSTAAGSWLDAVDADSLWRACRAQALFPRAVDALEAHGVRAYVDVGPSGTLSSFIKHKLGDERRVLTLATRFGARLSSLDTVSVATASRP